jgi:tetratricopeptide (TPR) repeat protein
LPTFFIVDPLDEQVAVRWVGGMNVAQLDRLVSGDPLAAKRRGSGIDARLAHADSLYGAGENAGAATAYEAVLAEAPAAWPPYARTVEALLFALSETESAEKCVAIASAALPRLKGLPASGSAAAYGLDCALSLPATHPERAKRVAQFEQACREVLADTMLAIAADDRSGLYISLLAARSDAGDSIGNHALASEWAAFLEREARRARTREQRVVFDPHRLSAYLELGEPERAIAMLEQSQREFPDDYNPPARLALAYRAMKRWPEALAASDAAMARAYGPRKLRIYDARADIHAQAGDSTAAKLTLEQAIQYGEGLPAGQRSEAMIASFRKKLAGYR